MQVLGVRTQTYRSVYTARHLTSAGRCEERWEFVAPVRIHRPKQKSNFLAEETPETLKINFQDISTLRGLTDSSVKKRLRVRKLLTSTAWNQARRRLQNGFIKNLIRNHELLRNISDQCFFPDIMPQHTCIRGNSNCCKSGLCGA